MTDNYIGNISTIVKYISMLIAGWFIGLLANYGFNLGIASEGLSELICAIIFLILAHIDATHPNTIFNQEPTTETPQFDINDIDDIPKSDINDIDDIDPASEYENTGDEDGC